jgi:hypothetical protein
MPQQKPVLLINIKLIASKPALLPDAVIPVVVANMLIKNIKTQKYQYPDRKFFCH